jgi:DNA (cytosine-5)-methyltransferase 1
MDRTELPLGIVTDTMSIILLMQPLSSSEAFGALNRARRIYSQKYLAERLDLHPRTIARWERGEVRIPSLVLPALREIGEPARSSPGTQCDSDDFTFIDLFAGIGGMRLGFEAVGGRCVFTSEWDAYSQKSYRTNFPNDKHELAGDITQVDAADVPDHDVLIGGFPCQPFSLAGVSKKNALGRPHGFECATQGTLFFDVARIIAAKQPRAFLLENVKNLISHDKRNTFKVIRRTLEDLGYKLHARVVDGQHFVPQHRERILIVGFREDTLFDWDAVSLPDASTAPRLGSILHPEDGTETDSDEGKYLDPDGRVHPKFTLTDRLWAYLQAYAAKHRAKGNGFGCSVVDRGDISRTLSARYYKDGSEILISRGPNRNPRRLTPRECARLMGYPDQFRIPVSDTRAYKQFGNSVVVPLIRHVAGLMKPWVMNLKESEAGQPSQGLLF